MSNIQGKNENNENHENHENNKITLENYADRTAGMESLIWEPTEKNLKVNHMLQMYLGDEHNVAEEFGGNKAQDGKTIEYLLAHAWNDTMLPSNSPEREDMMVVQETIGYSFANERLLLQAFTRRSFNTDPWLRGADYEVLELVGDSLMTAAVFKVILRQHARFLHRNESYLYFCDYDEGDVSRIRQKYTSKDYLADRCASLDFEKFIRYGEQDDRSLPGHSEDVMEAIVAAVAVDCDWDMEVIEGVVETLLDIHLNLDPWDASRDRFDTLNSWWQRKFGVRLVYRVKKSDERDPQGRALYECDLVFNLPALDPSRNWDAWYAQVGEDWYIPRHERVEEDVVFHSCRTALTQSPPHQSRSPSSLAPGYPSW